MENGFLVVDEKDWKDLTSERRDWLIFNTLKSLDNRMKCLEKRPFTDRALSLAGGMVGGFAAALGLKWGVR